MKTFNIAHNLNSSHKSFLLLWLVHYYLETNMVNTFTFGLVFFTICLNKPITLTQPKGSSQRNQSIKCIYSLFVDSIVLIMSIKLIYNTINIIPVFPWFYSGVVMFTRNKARVVHGKHIVILWW